MLKVLRPSKNTQTQGYSANHKAYDFSGRGDLNAYSSIYGKVTQAKNSETKNWINKGTLTTADYGNYCKIKGEIDGKTVYQLCAHMEPDSVLKQGEEVKIGQIVGKIGNTGNSTGRHLHVEYRDENNVNFSVSFVNEVPQSNETGMDKKQQYTEAYLGNRPNQPPSDDEINYRLQENKGLMYVLRDILEGDTKAREYWLKEWGIDVDKDQDYKKVADQYQETFDALKQILGLSPIDNTEEVVGKVSGLLETIKELQEKAKTKTIYKYEGKDYTSILKISNLVIILEGGVKNGS